MAIESAEVTTLFKRANRLHLPPSLEVLVLVDFIKPMQFPGTENPIPAAVRAAQAAARLKKRLRSHSVTAIHANDNYGTCVHLNAMDANMRGIKVWVPSDCSAAEGDGLKHAVLRQMSGAL